MGKNTHTHLHEIPTKQQNCNDLLQVSRDEQNRKYDEVNDLCVDEKKH